ncbi:MAG: sialidase family protein [Armatimonadota bacterium]
MQLLDVRRIWDHARHNAFTALIRHRDRWLCAFREGQGHAGDRGTIRILASADGEAWEPAVLLEDELFDLRDAKLSAMPDGRLLLSLGATDIRPSPGRALALRSMAAFSEDGERWTAPRIIVGEWEWLWRVTWHEGAGYGVAYHVGEYMSTPRETRHGILYRTTDGLQYEAVHRFDTPDGAGETTLRFEDDGTMRMVMRRDGNLKRTLLGTAKPPYTDWELKDVDYYLGGPDLIRLTDGWWLGTRGNEWGRTVLAAVDFEQGTISETINVDSGGDCSYPGLAWDGERLWMSYYSSHEGKAAIYLATFSM